METPHMSQLSRETFDINTITSKLRAQASNKIDNGQDYTFEYGQELIEQMMPHGIDFIKAIPSTVGVKPVLWNEVLLPLLETKKNSKVRNIVGICVYTMMEHLNGAKDFTSVAKEVYTRFIHNTGIDLSYATSDRMNKAGIAFFEQMIGTIASRSGIFTVSQLFGGSTYFLSLTQEYKEHVMEGRLKVQKVMGVSYRPLIEKPLPITSLVDGKNQYHKASSPVYKHPHMVDNNINPIYKSASTELLETLNQVLNTEYRVDTELLEILANYFDKGYYFEGYAHKVEQCLPKYRTKALKSIAIRNERRKAYAEFKDIEYKPLSKQTVSMELNKATREAQNEVNKVKMLLNNCFEDALETLWFGFFCDYRGRRYPYAMLESFMGDELNKSLICFKNKKRLTVQGINALFETLANALGKKWFEGVNLGAKHKDVKAAIAKRWFKEHKEQFMNGEWKFFFENQDKLEEPINALSICRELCNIIRNPKHETGIICHRDARSSGTSIISALVGCKTGMRLTSTIEDFKVEDNLMDAYTACADKAVEIAKSSEDPLVKELLLAKCLWTRDAFKKPTMTRCSYSLTDYGLREQCKDIFDENNLKADLGFNIEHIRAYFNIVDEALSNALPGCAYYLKTMRTVAEDIYNKRNGLVEVIHPVTGFPVAWQIMKERKDVFNARFEGQRIQSVIYKKSDKVDKMATINSFSANITHFFDSQLLLMVSKELGNDIDIACIHDSIGSHPNDCHLVIKAYAKAVHTYNTENILNKVLEQLTDIRIQPIDTDYEPSYILTSQHILA